MPDDVSDRSADMTRRELEDVVPVTADEAIVSGEVAGGDFQPADLGQARQQAALERRCGRALLLEQPCVDRERRPVGDELQQLGVVVRERSRSEGADVQHADRVAVGDERDAEQGADADVQEDGVADVRMIHLVEDHGPPFGRHSSREPLPDRNAHAAAHLFLDALRRGCDHLARGPVDEQDGRRVDLEDLSHPLQQRVEELVDLEVGERSLGDRLNPPELVCVLLEIGAETG